MSTYNPSGHRSYYKCTDIGHSLQLEKMAEEAVQKLTRQLDAFSLILCHKEK